MAKAKKKTEEPEVVVETPPEPSWERASVAITKSKAEVIVRDVSMAQYRKLVAEHGGEKVEILEVLQ